MNPKQDKLYVSRPQNLNLGYLDAVERGRLLQEKLKRQRGGGISTANAARLLRISPGAVQKRWRAVMLIGWTEGRSIMLARWQFRGTRVLPATEEVLRIIDSRDRWRVMLYFLMPKMSLHQKRPLDLLLQGKVHEVSDHAKLHMVENTC